MKSFWEPYTMSSWRCVHLLNVFFLIQTFVVDACRIRFYGLSKLQACLSHYEWHSEHGTLQFFVKCLILQRFCALHSFWRNMKLVKSPWSLKGTSWVGEEYTMLGTLVSARPIPQAMMMIITLNLLYFESKKCNLPTIYWNTQCASQRNYSSFFAAISAALLLARLSHPRVIISFGSSSANSLLQITSTSQQPAKSAIMIAVRRNLNCKKPV